ncbi:MAG: hypothetical protein LBR88_02940, partial [Zoogloeaceae bacterium]|nr:hypothetical protein [Zoogloeaceae bacterium]
EAAQQAEKLEAAARGGDFAFVAAHNDECVATLERLLADLSALLAGEAADDEAQKPLKETPDAATLEKLRAASAAYDMDGVDAALTELESYRYENRQELIAWLREQANATELARIAERLAKAEGD